MSVASWKDAAFKDLETRGFVLVPAFLSAADLDLYREDFERQPVDADNRNYSLSPVQGQALEAIVERVKEVIDLVTAGTDLRPDFPLGGSYFATRRGIRFAWHQDHESFFTIQNHYDYLNFYIPILKPRRDKSNLCIIPFDVLQRASPRIYQKVVRAGAASYLLLRDRTLVLHDDTGKVSLMDEDLERLAHTPQLEAGDLLLLRGDMIHRTEDTDTERVALSFRAARRETPVRRSRLADGSLVKAWMMMNDARTYQRMFQAFDLEGREAMGYEELLKTMESLPASASWGRKRFLRYLLRQKVREGLLLGFLGKGLRTLFVARAVRVLFPRPRASAPAAPPSPTT